MTRRQRAERSILLGLCAAVLTMICADGTQTSLAQRLLRLQIVAHSDAPQDQELKYQVRDTVAALAEQLTAECGDAQSAQAALEAALPQIEEAARLTVYRNARVTPVRAELGTVYYPTRDYGSFRLPAGEYTALRIVLGEGQGHNWWCVAYPALCTAAAGETLEQTALDAGLVRYQLRFITTDGETVRIGFWLVDAVGRFGGFLQKFR